MLLVCFWLAFGEDLVGGLGPGEWVAALVPAVDEGADLGVEVLDGGEDSSADGHTADCDTACPIFRTVDTEEVRRMLDVQMRSPRE